MATPPIRLDPRWQRLRQHTPARIGLKRSGAALATHELLQFQLAQAEARDAVHAALDLAGLVEGLKARGLAAVTLHSAAADRRQYLAEPDLGRRLNASSEQKRHGIPRGFDLALVLADGLSARAIDRHALPLVDVLLPPLQRAALRLAPVAVVEQGRVAIGDEIGERLGAGLVAVLIGERPGLSAPDSLGVYLTWAPRRGRSDAERNCLSNIRPAGLDYAAAAAKLSYLLTEARRRQLTGVALKEEADRLAPPEV